MIKNISDEAKNVMRVAMDIADQQGDISLRPEHVMISILESDNEYSANLLEDIGVDVSEYVEKLGEYIASTGYCDWKKVKRDEANMKIELIDIAVFSINLAYYSNSLTVPTMIPRPKDEFTLLRNMVTLLAQERYNELYYMILIYEPILQQVIVAKQALNTLRQNYGYKEGKYTKMWSEGKEDNAYLEAFYGYDYDEVYNKMEILYTEQIIPKSLIDAND